MSERYEDVRRKLVERGYLQGPIERFLLRDLFAGAAPRGLARTSAKAALLGAPLLGGLLAASTVAANRPLLGGADAMVLWGYFAIVAAAGLFVLDFAAAGLASAWARRRGARPSDALRAGLIVAAPVLGYLVVLWARGRPAGGFGADALFLAGAIVTAALVAWLAGLVSLAGIVGRTGEVPDRNRRPALLVLAVLVPLAAALILVPAAGNGGRDGAVPPSPFARLQDTPRLIVVGIDGLDGTLVERSASGGAVSNLLALFAKGALFPIHRPPAEPPEVWTTIATGTTADEHGVREAGATRLPGVAAPIATRTGPVALNAALHFLLPARTVPTTGAGRRVRALWEMTGLFEKTAVVGWWASWPARGTEGDSAEGYVVSDRVLAKLLAGRADDRDTAPASLYTRLASTFAADRAGWRAEFDGRFVAVSPEARSLAWESYLIDAFAWHAASSLSGDPALAASYVYLPGLDILRTRLAGRAGGTVAIDAYLRWLDESVVAGLSAGSADRIVVVADPGRSAGADAEGFVSVVGGGAAAACVGPWIGPLDVAPIVLRAAGLPASRELRGAAPARCFEAAAPEPARIATWGRRGRPTADRGSDYDPEMVERLKSLGYVR